MPIWQVLLLGIVQGITEFLPISSTAHLILLQEWFGRTREELEQDPVTVVIQLGTLFAVFVYYRFDIARMLKAFWQDMLARNFIRSGSEEGRLAKLIILGTVPGVLCGVLFKSQLKSHFYNGLAIALVAIIFSILMAAAEWWHQRRMRFALPAKENEQLTAWDALIIGLFQAMALMPGGSRSGTTMTAGLFLGLSRPTAARFSFLLSLPIMLGAGLKELYDWWKLIRLQPELQAQAGSQITAMILGTLVSAFVGYIAIAWLLRYLRRNSLMAFVWYRLILAAMILILLVR